VGGEKSVFQLTRGQTHPVVFRHVGLRKIPTVD
jgi:hypothetical protein